MSESYTIITGTDARDILDGTAGMDSIMGAGGNDVLYGEAGNDLLFGGEGDDALFGYGDDDNLYGDAGNDTLDGGAGSNDLEGGQGDDVIRGGDGRDVIVGGDGADQIDTGYNAVAAGGDRIDAGDGDDFVHLYGYVAPTKLDGGAGHDTINLNYATLHDFGAANRFEVLDGGGFITGTETADHIDLSGMERTHVAAFQVDLRGGDDVFTSAADKVVVSGGEGNDLIRGSAEGDSLQGDAGNDTIWGGGGSDTINAGQGHDELHGGDGNDFLYGGADGHAIIDGGDGDDVIDSAAGFSTLTGGKGNDAITAHTGDSIDAGDGDDTVIFVDTGAPVLLQGGAGHDTLYTTGGLTLHDFDASNGFEVVGAKNAGAFHGTAQADHIDFTGMTSAADWTGGYTIDLGDGNDALVALQDRPNYLYGQGGDDTIEGGQGDDIIDGGEGANTLSYAHAHDGLKIDLAAIGTYAGVDGYVDSAEGHDHIIRVQNVWGGSGNDVLLGDAKDNLLSGGDGNDLLDGRGDAPTGGPDAPFYLGDHDMLLGGNGDDTLVSGFGADRLEGGAGRDTYVYNSVYDLGGFSWIHVTPTPPGHTGFAPTLATVSGGSYWPQGDAAEVIVADTQDTLDVSKIVHGTGDAPFRYRGEGGFDDDVNSPEMRIVVHDGVTDIQFDLPIPGDVTRPPMLRVQGQFDLVESAGGSGVFRFTDYHAGSIQLSDGNDVAHTGASNDLVYGNDGDDVIYADGGNDVVYGGCGADWIDGGKGVDTLFGGAGNDHYVVDDNSDLVVENVGEGTDQVEAGVSYTLKDNVEQLLLTGSASLTGTGNDDDNMIWANAGDDTIYGGKGDDQLVGGQGQSHLFGGEGNDLLVGGSGFTRMDGGEGSDTYVYQTLGQVITEAPGGGYDTVQTALNHTLEANVEALVLTGGAGQIGVGNDDANMIVGNTFGDTLSGAGGNDTLLGGAGGDMISGGEGDDLLRGGGGTDTLTGGAGHDTFVIGTDGASTVFDLQTGPGGDVLDLSAAVKALGFATAHDALAAGKLAVSAGADGAVIAMVTAGGATPIAVLRGVAASALTAETVAGATVLTAGAADHHLLEAGIDQTGVSSAQAALDLHGGVLDAQGWSPFLFSLVQQKGAYGTALLNLADGTVSYQLDSSAAVNALKAGQTVVESFQVRLKGDLLPTMVSFTVEGTNDAPALAPVATLHTPAGKDVGVSVVDLLKGAIDPEGDSLSFGGVSNPLHGAVSWANGQAVFTPGFGFSGEGGFDYQVSDGHGGLATGHVTVVVDGATPPPVPPVTLTVSAPSAMLAEAGAAGAGLGTATETITVSGGKAAQFDTSGWTSLGGTKYAKAGAYGSVVLDVDSGKATYTLDNAKAATNALAQGQAAHDDFTVSAKDGYGGAVSATATLSFAISGANDAPTATPKEVSTSYGQAVKVTEAQLLAGAADPEGDTLHVTAVYAEHGTAVLGLDRSVTFTPATGYTGDARFTFTVSDGHGGSVQAQDVVHVAGAVPPPYVNGGGASSGRVFDVSNSPTAHAVLGTAYADTLTGGAGADALNGGGGDDVIAGGGGNDVVTGGAGADTVSGGSGADNFVFAKADFADPAANGGRYDVIAGFEGAGDGYKAGEDIMTFNGFTSAAKLIFEHDLAGDPTAHLYRVDDGAFHAELVVTYVGHAVLTAGDYGFH